MPSFFVRVIARKTTISTVILVWGVTVLSWCDTRSQYRHESHHAKKHNFHRYFAEVFNIIAANLAGCLALGEDIVSAVSSDDAIIG